MELKIHKQERHVYPIIAEANALQKIADVLETIPDEDHVVVLYDKSIEGIANKVSEICKTTDRIAIPSGEDSKSLQQVERIMEDLLLKKTSRKTVLVNVGGGMIMDIGGFIASIFMRGISHIQVPTTLLAMADAAIGGNTSVNLGKLKNMMGTEHHPKAVIVDTQVLGSLPDALFRDGIVEIIKMAAMADSEFFGWMEEHLYEIIDRKDTIINTCIEHAVRMKIENAEAAEKSEEVGMHFNFGHTVGHAVEALSHFTLSHGKAVSIGMACEMEIQQTTDKDRVLNMLEKLDMPIHVPLELHNAELWEVMSNDKKNFGEQVRVAVPEGIGKPAVQIIEQQDFINART